MAIHIYHLLAGLPIIVLAVLYMVVPRLFRTEEEPPRPPRRNKQTKRKKARAQTRQPRLETPPSSPTILSRTPSPDLDFSSGSDIVVNNASIAPSAADEGTAELRSHTLNPLEELAAQLDVAALKDKDLLLGITRFKTCMQLDLRFAATASRAAVLLHLIYDLHFTLSPDQPLPIRDSECERYVAARELACVFLNRYAAIFWPTEREPAPHLLDRSVQFPRDATINLERHAEWQVLMAQPPKKNSHNDLAMSRLGLGMTKLVDIAFSLPFERDAEADWAAVALVLDDLDVGEDNLGSRAGALASALRVRI